MNKLLFYIFILGVLACGGNKSKPAAEEKKTEPAADPSGPVSAYDYDLDHPEKFLMPDDLLEVSGICFYKGRPDTIYAEQDEEGRVYYLHLGDKKAGHIKFSKKGDFEDIAICNDLVVVLRSDGVLFSFPFNEIRKEDIGSVREWKDLLPDGEFEGMYADEKENQLYVLCKKCDDDNPNEAVTVTVLQIQKDGNIARSGSASVDVKTIATMIGEKKLKFHPSALARHPQTHQWYIVSSVNKLLVIADNDWKIKKVKALDPSIFRQPEGIAFDKENNLYISNEGDVLSKGNVLKFGLK
jgi:SdiA-regulated